MKLINALTPKVVGFSFLFFLLRRYGVHGVEETCTYDYNVIQRVGKTNYDGEPIKILDQSASTVRFTVGNTWTTGGDEIDQVFVEYPASTGGERECYLEENVRSGKSIGTSLEAYCTLAGVAMIRVFIRDSSFGHAKDTARIPDRCSDLDSKGTSKPGLEYLAVLNCLPTCTDNENQDDHFEISYPSLTPTDISTSEPSLSPTDISTSDPTLSPTNQMTSDPTLSPTNQMTSDPTLSSTDGMSIFSCPTPGEDPVPLSSFVSGSLLKLKKSSSGSMCTLIEVKLAALSDLDGVEIGMRPVARAYNGNDWEASAGPYSSTVFDCSQSGYCTVLLPSLQRGRSYALKSYVVTKKSDKNLKARFLEKTTFGPTKSEIEEFTSPDAWISAQFEMYTTSHRAFYRRHLTHWHTETSYHSLLDTNACEKGARYRKYVFIDTDKHNMMEIKRSSHDRSKYILSVDGKIRSLVDGPVQCGDWRGVNKAYPNLRNGKYEICWNPSEGLDGAVRVSVNGACNCDLMFGGVYGNPMVNFDDDHRPDLPVVDLGASAVPILNDLFYYSAIENELLQLSTDLTDNQCDAISSKTPGAPDTIRVGKTKNENGDSEYWIHTTFFKLRNNGIENPLPDGGKGGMIATADAPYDRMKLTCASAPKSFLNEDTCVLSDNACYDKEGPDVDIQLDLENLEKIHTETGGAGGDDTRYVYMVKGLRFDDDSLKHTGYPCTPEVMSRWIRVKSCKDAKRISNRSKGIFQDLLANAPDKKKNGLLRDIVFPSRGSKCGGSDGTSFGFKVESDGKCWENVHPDNYQVFDFTYWTTKAHPGNFKVNRIKEFAEGEKPTWELTFPDWHSMDRWHAKKENFPNVGRFGDKTTLKALPQELFRGDIAQAFGSTTQTVAAGGSVLVCGSPFEVATEIDEDSGPLGKGGFNMHTRHNRTSFGLEAQRTSIWIDIALKAKDQLRQRIAFALSQILVLSPDSISDRDFSEPFLVFYDIFVRHAFGNYFDILKEVTYSPLMAEMLTYNNGASMDYSWARTWHPEIRSPDENYAREIMQLFSIGLHKLNIDGTLQLDSKGKAILTYTNNDIAEYAKIYTGLSRHKLRSNVEDPRDTVGWKNNQIDPLKINPDKKDHLPKLGLDRQYVGDGSPLCPDLPFQHFLKTGAKYRLLGSDSVPDLLNDPNIWSQGVPKRLSLNFTSSMLSSKICDGNVNKCKPKTTFTLDEDIPCDGKECAVDVPRTLQVAPGIWYEYVRPACVNLAFFQDPKTIFRRYYTDKFMCGNPENYDASTVCCENDSTGGENPGGGWRNELFSGERVNFDSAKSRCNAEGKHICPPFVWIKPTDCKDKRQGGCDNKNLWYWTHFDCTLSVKVNTVGALAIIHNHGFKENPHQYTDYRVVRNDTKMFFRADWESDSDLEALLSNYQNGCTEMGGFIDAMDGLCQCPVEVNTSKLFSTDSELISIKNVLSKATIGAFIPDVKGENVSGVQGIRKYPKGKLSADTVFEFLDEYGRKHFRKNVVSKVSIGKGGLKIRNPVSFFSISEYTTRDARYEMDAVLDHFFYHQNMAPFLVIRLCQRLGISNPPPRLIQVGASAFRTGLFKNFGSGKYGCLQATIAAILLDREVQDATVDADPMQGSVREPFLKLVHLMRSLEFKSNERNPFLKLGQNLLVSIGQEPHRLPTVFSFFKPEYKPAGRIASAGLASPESQVLNGPTSLNMMNMMLSFVKYGVNNCFGGLGPNNDGKYRFDFTRCTIGASTNFGISSYNSSKYNLNTAEAVVDDLSTLLTSGRLSDANRKVMTDAYNYTMSLKKDPYEAMVNVQQLLVASPEFQTTSTPALIGETRPLPTKPKQSGNSYKAIIYVFLSGGADSYNMLVPNTCSGKNADGVKVSDQYLKHRGSLALNRKAGEFALTIPASGQPCSSFAVHHELGFVKELYDKKDLLWVANTGVVNQNGMTKKNFHSKTRTQLFAHNAMADEVKKVDPYNEVAGTGVLGRANDMLAGYGYVVNAMNIDGSSVALHGVPGKSTSPLVVSSRGTATFGQRPDGTKWHDEKDETYFDIEKYSNKLNGKTSPFSGLFGDLWSRTFIKGIQDSKDLKKNLEEDAVLKDSIWGGTPGNGEESGLWRRFQTIAKLTQTRKNRNANREVFYVSYSGFDHHKEMKNSLRPKMKSLNANLKRLVNQLKDDGLWDDTVIYVTSEFARTITPNQSRGSDHGWGQNVMLMGGKVKGGQVRGHYPTDISPSSPLDDGTGRGRFLPTTSNDAIWNSIIQWYGVKGNDDLDSCLPNRQNTINPVEDEKESPLFAYRDLFS